MIELGHGIGMDVVYWSRTRNPERERELSAPYLGLQDLFATSAVVSIHLSHTPETDQFIGRRLLELMTPTSILVNTARAEVVDNVALADLLARDRHLRAGRCVHDRTTATRATPGPELNVVLSPHIGFHTDEADDVFGLAAANILAYAAGAPTNIITTEP